MTDTIRRQTAELLQILTRALDTLVAAGASHQGLFPSILDRRTGEMLAEMPAAIPGQRDNDRAPRGSNLVHDEPTLLTMLSLGERRYVEAAEKYVRRFA